jgi:hypothetical protein
VVNFIKNKLVLVLIFILVLVSSFLAIRYFFWADIKLTNKNPDIGSLDINNISFRSYINFSLHPKMNGLWVKDHTNEYTFIHPEIISIFITDKMRLDNQEISYNKPVFNSTINMENKKTAILYVWASPEILNDPDFTQKLKDYIYRSIIYYQQKPNGK